MAKLSFEMEDEKIVLNIYQNIKYSKIDEFKDDLFLPFTDFTSGDGSYGGGRYIDLKIPRQWFYCSWILTNRTIPTVRIALKIIPARYHPIENDISSTN